MKLKGPEDLNSVEPFFIGHVQLQDGDLLQVDLDGWKLGRVTEEPIKLDVPKWTIHLREAFVTPDRVRLYKLPLGTLITAKVGCRIDRHSPRRELNHAW